MPDLNKQLCEAKSPIAVREYLRAEPGSVRKLTAAEVSEWRGRSKVSEAMKKTVEDLYEAKVMQADKKNQNGRIYPAPILKSEMARLGPLLSGGELVGTSGHPGDEEYAGDPSRISKKWVDLKMGDDGAMMGTFSVVPTEVGKDLKVVLDAKLAALGFSSYGFGVGAEPTDEERKAYGLGDDEYCVIMQPGYELAQIDSVRGPSVIDAKVTGYPDNRASESVQEAFRAGDAKKLTEGCSNGLHWKEVGKCGHVVSECVCEADTKHHIYSEKICSKCQVVGETGLTKEAFKEAMSASKPRRAPVSEAREPLAKSFTQYVQKGKDSFEPIGPVKLAPELSKDAFDIVSTWDGIRFVRHVTQTDALYHFDGSPTEQVLKEIDNFWGQKDEYAKYDIMFHRGVMMHGPPGMGKTAAVNQVVDMVTSRGDVVFYGRSIGVLHEGLTAFREVEPERKVVVVLEDADEYVGYQEREMLNLLDGANTISGILYLGTTNYLNRFPERLLRPGRFDKKVFVGAPPLAGRKAYLQRKLGKVETAEEIERLAKESEGLSFGALKELITAIYVLKEDKAAVIQRLKGGANGTRRESAAPPQKEAPVREHRLLGGKGELQTRENTQESTAMKTFAELKEQAPELHAAHLAAVAAERVTREAAEAENAKLKTALNPVLAGIKDVAGINLPQREVLPAEFADRQKSLEAKVATAETEKAALVAEKTALTGKIAELQSKLDAKERAAKVFAKARPILSDNSYAIPLRDAIREKVLSDASFDDTKVEAFIDLECVKYDKISGGKNKGKLPEGKGAKAADKGIDITDEEIDAFEDGAGDVDEQVSEVASGSKALAESF